MPAEVHPFHDPLSHTWSYLVVDPVSRDAAIVDPVLDFDAASGGTGTQSAQAVLGAARVHDCRVMWLLDTHAHADHLSAGHWLRQQLPQATLAIGSGIATVQDTFRPIFNLGEHLPVDGSPFDRLFDDGDTFAIGALAARAIAVPGHTSDSMAYLIDDALFTGDSLFLPDAGTARCDFPGGDASTLYRSVRRMFALPDATRVFVCHDYGGLDGKRAPACETTIGAQRRDNVHVGGNIDEAAFVTLREARDATLPMPALLLPAIQTNLRAGALPEPESNGIRYLKLPLDAL